jgi:hypothetical protein
VPLPLDTRPIWPGRVEILYRDYLTRKSAYITSHPSIRP